MNCQACLYPLDRGSYNVFDWSFLISPNLGQSTCDIQWQKSVFDPKDSQFFQLSYSSIEFSKLFLKTLAIKLRYSNKICIKFKFILLYNGTFGRGGWADFIIQLASHISIPKHASILSEKTYIILLSFGYSLGNFQRIWRNIFVSPPAFIEALSECYMNGW